MQLTKLNHDRYNAMLAYCLDSPKTAFQMAENTGQNKQNMYLYTQFLMEHKLIKRLHVTKEMNIKNQKYMYKSLVPCLPETFTYAEENKPAWNTLPIRHPQGRIINFDNLPHNTGKGIIGRRSAFIGNSLETMTF